MERSWRSQRSRNHRKEVTQQMREGNPWSRLREEWEVVWVKPSGKDGVGEPSVPHTFLVSRSGSLQLFLQAKASQQQMAKEVNGLLQAINEGLLDDLDHDIPPGSWIADDYGV
jgi:hypothetical protein